MKSNFYLYKNGQNMLSDETHRVRNSLMYLLACTVVLVAFQDAEIESVLGIKFRGATLNVNDALTFILLPIIYLVIHFNFKINEDCKVIDRPKELSTTDIASIGVSINEERLKDILVEQKTILSVNNDFNNRAQEIIAQIESSVSRCNKLDPIMEPTLYELDYTERFKKFLAKESEEIKITTPENSVLEIMTKIANRNLALSEFKNSYGSELKQLSNMIDQKQEFFDRKLELLSQIYDSFDKSVKRYNANIASLSILLEKKEIKFKIERFFNWWIPNIFAFLVVVYIINITCLPLPIDKING